MSKVVISLGQMRIAVGDVGRNYTAAERLIAEAARRGSHLIMLPELWSTGYALERANELSSALNAGIFAQVAKLAKDHNICVCGSMLEKRGMEVTNSAVFFSPKGQLMGVYRKIHLFRLMNEHVHLKAGSSPLVMDLPWGPTGVAICYDLRFPELFRRYAVEGAKMVIIPAEWPIERAEHWTTLLKARAIENQMYIVAVNNVGESGGTTFAGQSMIVDPWGKVVVAGGEEPGLFTAEVDFDRVNAIREKIPVFEDRRPDLYEPLDFRV
ncbi:MAG: Omega-amidase YafV [Anaerolineae bacterium]|jgi:predicted amidohydrolase|nr:MAG: putative hydrolase [Chloroflexi bacterium OLB13]MBV6436126.1 Omega-amidase YafV [Anaerolineae bacterium]MEB2365924.1 carbon-nitrogen family hydrolase [Chloroflexota bacterium]GIK29036.1 MAG: carbon-nitrogen hydrolase [Chloroflexota bacterium]